MCTHFRPRDLRRQRGLQLMNRRTRPFSSVHLRRQLGFRFRGPGRFV